MKKIYIILLGLAVNLSAWSQVGPWLIPPDEVIAHYSRSFIPEGFDNNDNAQVVATGHYQNGCYKKGNTTVNTDLENRRIDINITHYFSPDELCIMWVQPYQEDVSLGVLPEGNYQVFVNGQQTRNNLSVHLAQTNNVDDYLYAPVANVNYDRDTSTLTLSGFFFDHCAQIEEIQVTKQVDRNVVIALPIVSFRADCDPSNQQQRRLNRWESSVQVDTSDIQEKVLFHVRAMNGEAKNHIVDLR